MKDIDPASLPAWIVVPLTIIMFLGGWLLAIVGLTLLAVLVGQSRSGGSRASR